MKLPPLLLSVLLTSATLGLTGGCTVYTSEPAGYVSTEIDVAGDPPPVLVESVPVSPGINFVWVGGAWVWRNHWVWEPGRWLHPPRPGAVWYPHRYEVHGGRHVFIRGGWR